MLLAQLHRKVPGEFEGMEDVLTSTVFGLLKYLPGPLAKEILEQYASISSLSGTLQLEFWARYSTPAGFRRPTPEPSEEEPDERGDTEPDVIITSANWLVLVEAKYRSTLDEFFDQLGREFAVGYQLAQAKQRRFRLLVVTAHARPPTPAGLKLVTGVQQALKSASTKLGKPGAEMIAAVPDSLHWTSWQQLYSLAGTICHQQNVPKHIQRLLEDIQLLLELRGLKPYDNQLIVRLMDKWLAVGISEELWAVPVEYHYQVVSSYSVGGWKQLLEMDILQLHPLACRFNFNISASNYNLDAQLSHFGLDSLKELEWQPLKNKEE